MVGFARQALVLGINRVKQELPEARRARRHVQLVGIVRKAIDEDFDRRFHVDTGGKIELSAFKIDSKTMAFGCHYRGIDPDLFHEMMLEIEVDYTKYAFVDLGSGKGRALLLASHYPFKKIIGVEFAAELHQVAERNVRDYCNPARVCKSVEAVQGDAIEFPLPTDPLVLYLYNPFDAEVMRPVVDRVCQSIVDNPRDVIVAYYNPRLDELWSGRDCLERFSKTAQWSLYRSTAKYRGKPVKLDARNSVR